MELAGVTMSAMPEIDVHGYTLVEALARIVLVYNRHVGPQKKTLHVVHGYGSTGKGGVIRYALRAYLMAHAVGYEEGESIERNKGTTLIIVGSQPIEDEFLMFRLRRGFTTQKDNVDLFARLKTQFEKRIAEQEADHQRLHNLAISAQRERDKVLKLLQDREHELLRNTVQTRELEARQQQLVQNREQLQQQCIALEAQQREALAAGEQAMLEDRRQASEELARRIQQLDENKQRIEAEREELQRFRSQLQAYRDELSGQKDTIEQDLRQRTDQLNKFAAELEHTKHEQGRLPEDSAQDVGPALNDGTARSTRPLRIAIGLLLAFILAPFFIALCFLGTSSSSVTKNHTETPSDAKVPKDTITDPLVTKAPIRKSDPIPTKRPRSTPSVISPSDASMWEGKEVTVAFKIGSTSDRLSWAFVINSEANFRASTNFQVLVENNTAGRLYKVQGIASLDKHFHAGDSIRVTGVIEQFKSRNANREQYQIRVRDPSQITKN
jgi:hypothetical protein